MTTRIGDAVRSAFDDPLPDPRGAGRPRKRTEGVVKKIVVFMEVHADGDIHFHVAVCLSQSRTWMIVKRTLRQRDHLPSHFSVSHTQFWSVVRYGFIPTLSKPDVDPEPAVWTCESGQWTRDGVEVNLFEESQKPFNANMWKRRREEAEKAAASQPGVKVRRFGKLDLTAVILSEGLTTKAGVLEYVQDRGTEEMQIFVHNHQKQVKEFVKEAQEWAAAREDACAERESDWALLCRKADAECPHGDNCFYRSAAEHFFEANQGTLDMIALAAALRAIIKAGPSKTTRTPLIAGPSNSGKSTIVVPFDDLFGSKKVFHKPALTSSFPLANIVKEKRFLFWDDYRPVDYAQSTVHVATFLALFNGFPFEVKQSGAFNDGNEDFSWNRGCLLTAKSKELWKPYGEVTAEDVEHMKNRMICFTSTAVIKNLKDTQSCACCMARWVRDGAAEADAKCLLNSASVMLPVATTNPPGQDSEKVAGLSDLAIVAQLPGHLVPILEAGLLAEGAVSVKELTLADWQALPAFVQLKPLQQRRVLAAVGQGSS